MAIIRTSVNDGWPVLPDIFSLELEAPSYDYLLQLLSRSAFRVDQGASAETETESFVCQASIVEELVQSLVADRCWLTMAGLRIQQHTCVPRPMEDGRAGSSTPVSHYLWLTMAGLSSQQHTCPPPGVYCWAGHICQAFPTGARHLFGL